jgi:hypothetical protein
VHRFCGRRIIAQPATLGHYIRVWTHTGAYGRLSVSGQDSFCVSRMGFRQADTLPFTLCDTDAVHWWRFVKRGIDRKSNSDRLLPLLSDRRAIGV